MRETDPKAAPKLLRMLAGLRRSSLFAAGLIMGMVLLIGGGVMLFVPVITAKQNLTIDDLVISVFGCAGIAVGVFLLLNSALWQLAHEILLCIDGKYNSVYRTNVEGQQEQSTAETKRM